MANSPSLSRMIVLATRNPGKIAEMRGLLAGLSLEIHTPDDYPGGPLVEETAPDLLGNALLKARAWHEHTGLPALADDTGLEVDALGGEPGVRSARYGSADGDAAKNRAKLLRNLDGQSSRFRTARFRTVVVLAGVGSNGAERIFEGVCEGAIGESESGTGGFGYDSVFIPAGFQQTFAELDPEVKNQISHRGIAIRKSVEFLRELFPSKP